MRGAPSPSGLVLRRSEHSTLAACDGEAEPQMPLFRLHRSVSWPPSSPIVPLRATDQPGARTPSADSIDEDPFAYFISPPSLTITSPDGVEEDGYDRYDVFEDLSAGILPDGRPRSRSLSPFRSSDVMTDFDVLESAAAVSPGKPRRQGRLFPGLGPAPLKGLRKLMHIPHPSTPRLKPQGLSEDDVPDLDPLSPERPSISPSMSTSCRKERDRGRGRSRARTRGRGRGRSDAAARSTKTERVIGRSRLHSDRPRSWREPSWDLWTVLEERDWTQEEMMAMVQQAAMSYERHYGIAPTISFVDDDDDDVEGGYIYSQQDDGSDITATSEYSGTLHGQTSTSSPTHEETMSATASSLEDGSSSPNSVKPGKRKKKCGSKEGKGRSWGSSSSKEKAPAGYAYAKRLVKRIRLW